MAIQQAETEYQAFNIQDALSLIEKAQEVKISDGFEKDARAIIGEILPKIKELAKEDYLTPFKEVHVELKKLQVQLNQTKIISEIGIAKQNEFLQYISTIYRACFEQILKSRKHNEGFTEVSACFLKIVECEQGTINQAPLFNPANESLQEEWKRILDKKVDPLLQPLELASNHRPFLEIIIQVKEFLKTLEDDEYIDKYCLVKKNQLILPYLKKAVRSWIEALRKSPANKCEDFLKASDEIINVLKTRKLISERTNAGISENIDFLICSVKLAKVEVLAAYSSSIPKKTLPKWTPQVVYRGVKKFGQVIDDPNADLKGTIKMKISQLLWDSGNIKTIEMEYPSLIESVCERGYVQELKKAYFLEQMPETTQVQNVAEINNNSPC